jgi:hypothetical protein
MAITLVLYKCGPEMLSPRFTRPHCVEQSCLMWGTVLQALLACIVRKLLDDLFFVACSYLFYSSSRRVMHWN